MGRALVLQAGAGAFEGAVDRFYSRIQHVGHLVRLESENVAQDEDGELARRENLEAFTKAREMDSMCS